MLLVIYLSVRLTNSTEFDFLLQIERPKWNKGGTNINNLHLLLHSQLSFNLNIKGIPEVIFLQFSFEVLFVLDEEIELTKLLPYKMFEIIEL